MTGQEIIQWLENERRERRMTDEAFAGMLGISRPLWSQLRSGKRRLTVEVLRGILRAFPEREGEIMSFLREVA